MDKHLKVDNTKVELSDELLISFAKALTLEIRKFYNSDKGRVYFEKWITKHPEYDERASA